MHKNLKIQNCELNADSASDDDFENYDPRDDQIKELSDLAMELVNENTLLKDGIIAKITPSQADGSINAGEVFECLQKEIKFLHSEIRVLKACSDSSMARASENMQQLLYWKKRAKRVEKELAEVKKHLGD